MPNRTFDIIVIGAGGMGTAVAAETARRRLRTLVLEQFSIGHHQGSSHGQSRIIRRAYYEHPAYVPLADRSFELWRRLEKVSGDALLTPSPCLNIGPPQGELVSGVRTAAQQHRLPVDELSAADLAREYPQFQFDDSYGAIRENDAGILAVERCVSAQARSAERSGANIHTKEWVVRVRSAGGAMEVVTDRNRYVAPKVVVTAGPWLRDLMGTAAVRLTVMRQSQWWFQPNDPAPFALGRFPVYIAETPGGHFYGIPSLDDRGPKTARHYGSPELSSPAELDRDMDPNDQAAVRAFLDRHVPAVGSTVSAFEPCIYTLTPDRHFLIDRHPAEPRIVVAGGFSGHGFKFAPVVGEIAADLSTDQVPPFDISLFRWDRPALASPAA